MELTFLNDGCLLIFHGYIMKYLRGFMRFPRHPDKLDTWDSTIFSWNVFVMSVEQYINQYKYIDGTLCLFKMAT